MIDEPIREVDRAKGEHAGNQNEDPGGVLAAGLNERVDADGDGACPPWYRAGDHDGGAEFSERAREAKYGARGNASRRERQCDAAHDPPWSGAEGGGDLFIAAIDLL